MGIFLTVELKKPKQQNLKINSPFLKVVRNLYAKLAALWDLAHLGFAEFKTLLFPGELMMFQEKNCVMSRISISTLTIFVIGCFSTFI